MVIVIRTIAVVLALGLLAVGFFSTGANAQGANAQIVITTNVASGASIPSSPLTVTVTGAGPSLTSTPGSSGTLVFGSNFNGGSHVITLIPSNYTVYASNNANHIFYYSAGCSGTAYAGEVKTCTITASQGGIASVTVYKNVVNNNGGTRIPSDFTMQVTGQSPAPATFSGSSSGTVVNLNPGFYAVNEVAHSGYTKSLSNDCSGNIAAGERRTCIITNDDMGSVLGTYTSRLSCLPSRQATRVGDTVTFTAQGGVGTYSWATADRTYINAGPTLNAILQTTGTQTVIVTSGSETAYCTVDVASFGTIVTPPSYPSSGVVLGVATPGLPNTGFGPNPLALALMIALMVGGTILAFPYVRATATSIWS